MPHALPLNVSNAMNDLVNAKLARRPKFRELAAKVRNTHEVGYENGRLRFYRKTGEFTMGIRPLADGADITVLASGVYRIAAGGRGTLTFGGPTTSLSREMILETFRIAIKASGGSPYVPLSSPQPLMFAQASVANSAPMLLPGKANANVGLGTIERYLVGTPAGAGVRVDDSEGDEPLGVIDATNAFELEIVNFDAVNPVDFTCDGSMV